MSLHAIGCDVTTDFTSKQVINRINDLAFIFCFMFIFVIFGKTSLSFYFSRNKLIKRPILVYITGRFQESFAGDQEIPKLSCGPMDFNKLSYDAQASFAVFLTNFHGLCCCQLKSQISWLRLLYLTFLSYRGSVLPGTMIFLIYPLFATNRENRDFILEKTILFSGSHSFYQKPFLFEETISFGGNHSSSESLSFQQKLFHLIETIFFSGSHSFK